MGDEPGSTRQMWFSAPRTELKTIERLSGEKLKKLMRWFPVVICRGVPVTLPASASKGRISRLKVSSLVESAMRFPSTETEPGKSQPLPIVKGEAAPETCPFVVENGTCHKE